VPKQAIDSKTTAITKARYDRVAPIYDLMEGLMEQLTFRKWRKLVWETVQAYLQNSRAENSVIPKILEIGVGTGKNFSYYPQDAQITAIDLSDRMLMRARKRAKKLSLNVELLQMDAQALEFEDHSFDTVVATFVFCSVPNPVLGLREIKRVLRPSGRVVLLEHMRPESRWLGRFFDLINPLVVRLWGANINRRTLENICKAGLQAEQVHDLTSFGIVRLIIAGVGKKQKLSHSFTKQ